MGADFGSFLTRPREYVRTQVLGTQGKPLAEILGWSIAAGALVWGIYTWAVGPIPSKLDRAAEIAPAHEVEAGTVNPKVRFQRLFWQAGFSLGVEFPEACLKGWTAPQTGVFQMGMGGVVLENVEPLKLGGVAGKLALLLYAFVTVASLHLPARVAGARVCFPQEVRLSCIFYAYIALLAVLGVVLGSFALIDLGNLHGSGLLIFWPLCVVVPTFAVTFRCFFAAFSELYSVSKRRLFLIGVGSALVSSVFCPVVFAPFIYFILRFKDLLELIV